MNVKQLIAELQTFDPALEVVYRCCSEYDTLDVGQIEIKQLTLPRADGWVQDYRPDMPSKLYLAFPGN